MKAREWALQMARSYSRKFPDRVDPILRGIISGVNIDYEGDRSVNRVCQNLKSATTDEAEQQVNNIIEADCKSGKKSGPHDRQPFLIMSVSPIGAVPKKSGKLRVIHHLSFPFGGDSINARTKDIKIELGRFDDAAEAIRMLGPGCLLIKLDVEAAYKQVPVRREDWPLIGFKWRGKWYYERTLPFGLKSSCRLWEMYATALHHFFEHDLGIKCVVHYIDDFLFVVEADMAAAVAHLERTLSLCVRIGVPLAADKTEGPTTALSFLGIELDTVRMTAALSAAKLAELQLLLRDWGQRKSATIKELQSLTGMLNFACCVVRPGRAFLRRIIDHTTQLDRAERVARGGAASARSHRQIGRPIPPEVQADIEWWRRFIGEFNGVSLLYEKEWIDSDKIELFTDACQTGFGGSWGRRFICGPWDRAILEEASRQRTLSMPFLELYAVVLAAAAWGQHWAGRKIMLRTDCMPAMHAINQRTSRSAPMAALMRQLMLIAARWGFDFRARHIAGKLNVAADALSRDDMQAYRAEVNRRSDGPEGIKREEPSQDPTPVLPPLSQM